MALGSWRQLSDGGADLVLCLDFAGGRADAGFADLAATAPVAASFFHLERAGMVAPLAACAGRWVDEVRRAGRPVRGVLGFCAGAPLATAFADALAAAGAGRPPVLLFDAAAVTGATLCGAFLGAVESSAAHLAPGELDGARELCDDLAGSDLPSTADRLVERYRELTTRLAGRLRLGPVLLDGLVGDFAAYMSYLLIASDGTLDVRGGTPVFLSSTDHEPEFEPVTHLPFPVSRHDLLADAEVAKAVADLLDRGHREEK